MPVPSFDATGGHDQAAFGRVERSGHFSIHLISWNQTMVEASARSSAGCDAALMSKSTVGILLAQEALLHSYRSRESGMTPPAIGCLTRVSYPGVLPGQIPYLDSYRLSDTSWNAQPGVLSFRRGS